MTVLTILPVDACDVHLQDMEIWIIEMYNEMPTKRVYMLCCVDMISTLRYFSLGVWETLVCVRFEFIVIHLV